MQIERQILGGKAAPGRSKTPYCPLECDNCTGICLAVYFMLTPQEKTAVCHLADGFGHHPSNGMSKGRLS